MHVDIGCTYNNMVIILKVRANSGLKNCLVLRFEQILALENFLVQFWSRNLVKWTDQGLFLNLNSD